MEPSFSPESTLDRAALDGQRAAGQQELITHALSRHIERIGQTHSERAREWLQRARSLWVRPMRSMWRERAWVISSCWPAARWPSSAARSSVLSGLKDGSMLDYSLI